MHQYGFAVVGTGNISAAHIDSIERLPNARLVGVLGRSPEQARDLARKHDAKAYDDLNSLVADDEVEVVCVCTPSGAHLEPAVAAAQAGKQVVVEKPLEVTVERARRIIEAAEQAGVKLATIFMARFSDSHRLLKRTIEAGELGRLLQADASVKWYRSQAYYDSSDWRGTWALDGGGALMNQAIHAVDMLLWLMGPIQEVFAYAATLAHERLEVEDTLVAVLRYANGGLGQLSAATSLFPGQPKVMDIHGDKGYVRVKDDSIEQWQLAGVSDEERERLLGRYSAQASGTFSDPMAMSFENHRRQLEEFLRAVETDVGPLVDGYEGLRSVEVAEAIYRSARTGAPVELATRDRDR
ncbi:MAG TPA: Gfo/Idh/MocA family oxidoreductase [Trueperaceae bacterium]